MFGPSDPDNPMGGLLGDLMKVIGSGPGAADSWFEAARTLAFGVATDGGEDENPDRWCASPSRSWPGWPSCTWSRPPESGPPPGGGVSFEAVGPGQWSFRVLEAYRPVLKSMVEAQQQGAAAVPSSLRPERTRPRLGRRPQRAARAVRPHARPRLPRHAVRLGRGAPRPARLRAVRPPAPVARVVDPAAGAGQREPLRRGLEPPAPGGAALGLPARAHHARRAEPPACAPRS